MAVRWVVWAGAALCVFWSQVASAELITGFDVVVGGNLALQGQVQGKTLVAGNVVAGFPSFGTGLSPSSTYSNTDVLVVGGSLQNSGVTMQAGDVRVGGSFGSAAINLNGVGSEKFEHDASAVAQSQNVGQQLQSLSSAFSGQDANSTWSLNGTTVTFNANPGANGLAVFDVPASLLTMQNANFLLSTTGLPATTSYAFNVLGQLTGTPLGNFGQGFNNQTTAANTLWNFAEQTFEVTLSREWYGSILLPGASLTTSGAVNGGVYVAGNFTSSGEIRTPSYAGVVPSAVPEPSSFIMVAVAALGLAGTRLRRRRIAARENQRPAAPGISLSV